MPTIVLIGKWSDVNPPASSDITILKEDDSFKVLQEFWDGSKLEHELLERRIGGEIRFVDNASKHGDYFVIDEDGNLGLYDRDGLMRTAKPIK